MSYFRRSDETLETDQEDEVRYAEDEVRYDEDEGRSAGSRWGGLGERLVKVFTVQEPDETERSVVEPDGDTAAHDVLAG